MMSRAHIVAPIVLFAMAAALVRAEVLDSAANGFSVRYSTLISAGRAEVYGTAVDKISEWWSSDHTFNTKPGQRRVTCLSDGLDSRKARFAFECNNRPNIAGLNKLEESLGRPPWRLQHHHERYRGYRISIPCSQSDERL